MPIYIYEDGVIGIALAWFINGVKAMWFIDGIRYESFLTFDEFVEIDKNFKGDME